MSFWRIVKTPVGVRCPGFPVETGAFPIRIPLRYTDTLCSASDTIMTTGPVGESSGFHSNPPSLFMKAWALIPAPTTAAPKIIVPIRNARRENVMPENACWFTCLCTNVSQLAQRPCLRMLRPINNRVDRGNNRRGAGNKAPPPRPPLLPQPLRPRLHDSMHRAAPCGGLRQHTTRVSTDGR